MIDTHASKKFDQTRVIMMTENAAHLEEEIREIEYSAACNVMKMDGSHLRDVILVRGKRRK